MLPWLRRAGGGTIVNVISITVHGGTPHLAAYVGAKGAGGDDQAAVGRDRVWVNGLNLGWTVTPGERVVQTQTHGWPPDWDQAVGIATLRPLADPHRRGPGDRVSPRTNPG